MTNRFGLNGFPTGSLVEVLLADDRTVIGKKYTIVGCQQWSDKFKDWMYIIDCPLGGVTTCYVQHKYLKLIKLPFFWENWATNCVTKLLAHNDTIALDLAMERKQGDWK